MSSNDKKRKGDCSGTEPPLKRTSIRCSEEPDVTIVVGGEVFQEFRQALRCWSGYFDRALSSGMKEQTSLKFEFPDRDPREWEWIISLMAPLSTEKISVETIPVALDWFDFLSSDAGIKECDRVLSTYLDSPDTAFTAVRHTGVMNHLAISLKYNLRRAIDVCYKVIRKGLSDNIAVFDEKELKEVVILVKQNKECRNQFLDPMKAHLPASITEEKLETLIESEILHSVLFLRVEHLRFRKKVQERAKYLVRIGGSMRQLLSRDNFFGPLIASDSE